MKNTNYVFKNPEVNKALEWWLVQYGYEVTNKENGLYLEDLQDESLSKYTTEEKVIAFFIEQIENKMDISGDNTFKDDLEILKRYR